MIRLHDLKPAKGAHKRKTRVGRGVSAGQGMSSGRGTAGQGARPGGTKAPYFEGGQLPLVRRLPFKRGFNNLFKIFYQPISLTKIAAAFKAGDEVNPETLVAKGLLKEVELPIVIVGVPAGSEPLKLGKLTVAAHRFSAPAKDAIEAAGGTAKKLVLATTGARATVKLQRKADRPKQETK